MKQVKAVKVLIILATLMYLYSLFEPWLLQQWEGLVPEVHAMMCEEELYWSYRAIIQVHGVWSRHHDLFFFEFWNFMYGSSYYVGWIGVFFFQILTIAFGCISIFLKANTRKGAKIVVVVIMLLSSTLAPALCTFQRFYYLRLHPCGAYFQSGFWIATLAFVIFLVTIVVQRRIHHTNKNSSSEFLRCA